jgi:hypothetical protein
MSMRCETSKLSSVIGIWFIAPPAASRAATAHGRFGKWANDRLATVGDVCRQVQGEALAALIGFCVTQVEQGGNLDDLLKQVLSHLAR